MFSTFISVDTLAAHLEDASWVVVDCRYSLADLRLGRRQYDEAHISGAFFVDLEADLSGAKNGTNGRHPLPEPERFERFLQGFGVRSETQLVAYDAGGDMGAARFWFLCRYIGHNAVAVLDGGFTAWRAAEKPVTAALPAQREPGDVVARPRNELIVDAAAIMQNLQTRDFTVVDARGNDRYRGLNETIDPIAGHIPGALNRPFKENFETSGAVKAAGQLRRTFSALGDPERFVHQCGSGVSATVNMLAMEHAGLSGSRLYPGSWSEWIADPSRPTATGDP